MNLPPPPESEPDADPPPRRKKRRSATRPLVQHLPPFSRAAGFALPLAILGFLLPVLGLLASLFSVVLGHLAVDRIKRATKPGLRGMPAARIALVLGYLPIVTLPALVLGGYFSVPLVQQQVEKFQQGRTDVAMEHARSLWQTAETYASEHGDRYPANWTQLEGRYLSNPELRALLNGRKIGQGLNRSTTSFRLVPHERPILPALEGTIIVIHEVAPDAPQGEPYDQIVIYDDGVAGTRRTTAP